MSLDFEAGDEFVPHDGKESVLGGEFLLSDDDVLEGHALNVMLGIESEEDETWFAFAEFG